MYRDANADGDRWAFVVGKCHLGFSMMGAPERARQTLRARGRG